MNHTNGVAILVFGILLPGGCGELGTTLTGEGPNGSFAVEGPDPNALLEEVTDLIFTDDPAFIGDTPSDGSGGDSTGPGSDDEATPPPDDNDGSGAPEPEPEPEPQPFPGNVSNGSALYRLNCQECHGAEAVGGTAAGIRGASVGEINTYINGKDRHPRFGGFLGFTADDVQDVAAYLNSL